MLNNEHDVESRMHEHTEQRNTVGVRLREHYSRASTVYVTDITALCQMWIDFEERIRDIHLACPILELAKNVIPKLNNAAVPTVVDDQPTEMRTSKKLPLGMVNDEAPSR